MQRPDAGSGLVDVPLTEQSDAPDEPTEPTEPEKTAIRTRPADISGLWSPDDGSGAKTIGSDGHCSGMYYNGSRVLDIGGPMTCMLGEMADSAGRYTLVVQQSPNQRTYAVEFADDDTMTLTDVGVTLTRR